MEIPTDLEAFDKFCACHDWFYYMSDDHRVYMRGVQSEGRLLAFTRAASDEHKRIYNKHHERCFNQPCFTSHNRKYEPPFPEVAVNNQHTNT